MTRCYEFDSKGCPDLRGTGRTITLVEGRVVDEDGARASVVVRVDTRAEAALLASLSVSPLAVWSEPDVPVATRTDLEAAWVREERQRLSVAVADEEVVR